MDNAVFVSICTNLVAEKEGISTEEVYVVWLTKVLQNNKALLSTTVPNGMYYELTFNGSKDELYFDAYKKESNIKIDLGGKIK